ncbi:MAG: helix-turn-helix transcriptional regulator [Pedobacter sp.]|nr:helix-turn-helix transcriptional regulator [Pedobacter sp.]
MNKFHFGERVKTIRLSKGITQESIAFQLNITQSTYSRIEAQAETPSYDKVSKIVEALGEDIAIVMEGSGLRLSKGLFVTDTIPKARVRFYKYLSRVVALGVAVLVAPPAWELANGLCNEFALSKDLTRLIRFSAGCVAMGLVFYWVNKIVKRYVKATGVSGK